MCNVPIYFCNIDIKCLQHISETCETLEICACNMRFQHNVTLLLWQIEARRHVELDARADINAVAEWGVWQVGRCSARDKRSPHWRRTWRTGRCGARGAALLRWRKAAVEGDCASPGRTSIAGGARALQARMEASGADWEARRPDERTPWEHYCKHKLLMLCLLRFYPWNRAEQRTSKPYIYSYTYAYEYFFFKWTIILLSTKINICCIYRPYAFNASLEFCITSARFYKFTTRYTPYKPWWNCEYWHVLRHWYFGFRIRKEKRVYIWPKTL
jgi:hypothetical protein